jgi:hypothetical protein
MKAILTIWLFLFSGHLVSQVYEVDGKSWFHVGISTMPNFYLAKKYDYPYISKLNWSNGVFSGVSLPRSFALQVGLNHNRLQYNDVLMVNSLFHFYREINAHYAELPVNIKYFWFPKRAKSSFKVTTSLGWVGNFLFFQKGIKHAETGDFPFRKAMLEPSHQMLQFKFGCDYFFHDNFELSIEPTFRYVFADKSGVFDRTAPRFTTGLQLSLIYSKKMTKKVFAYH